MVRPAAFGYNAETASSNAFQHLDGGEGHALQAAAVTEFDALVAALRTEGIFMHVVEDTDAPPKPDAVFPNNWVSFHADGRVVLYPMHAPNRRLERRRDVLDELREQGVAWREIVDLSHHERSGRYLEGTGSLVLDHVGRIAYACRSVRTDDRVLREWCEIFGYEAVLFDATDREGRPLYHTNVLMSIGARYALIGAEAIEAAQRDSVLERLGASGRDVLCVNREALANFAGNMLELATWDEALGDSRVLVMSARARAHLAPETYARLSAATDAVLVVPVPTLERVGGGGVRCMLAEVFCA